MSLGALVFGYLAYKNISNNHSTKDSIERMRTESMHRIARLDRNIDESCHACNLALEKLYLVNKDVYDSTFPAFLALATKIMNVDFDDRVDPAQTIKFGVEIDTTVSNISSHTLLSMGGNPLLLACAPGASMLLQAVYAVKLKADLAEVRTEHARIEAAVEIAKREIAKMRSITKLAETATQTIIAMQKLGDAAINTLTETVNNFGVDYNAYPQQAKDTTWLSFKIISALNELVNMKILTESGAISAKFRKFVGDISAEYLLKD